MIRRFIGMVPGAVEVMDLGAAGTAMLEKKARASSGRLLLLLLVLAGATQAAAAINLSPAETRRIGNKIWQNECGGTVAGLTSWNAGENFASLGIGHFIWYPKGVRGPFEESFPKFVEFAASRSAKLPAVAMAKDGCPWHSRAEFNAAAQSASMKELRAFLAGTVDLQAEFLVRRLREALPKMLAEGGASNHAQIQERFDRVAATANGCYALVDYVNFKGEGVLATERYAGQGWGLLQVLQGMTPENTGGAAVKSFADSAKTVLKNRVRNSPRERNEAKWLPGWLKRVDTYVGG
ncbi:MAG TPA: hypothetical protein VGW57_12695 [Chthoniobacterales bacterium]|nr:hypothetical protein [Chthoniobacterales bacterium]